MLQEYLACYKDIFQYVYLYVFPEIYTSSEKRGFDLKSSFHIMVKAYRDKMLVRQQQLVKQPANYEQQPRKESFEFGQKPLENFNQFSDSEENEIKQHAQKRLAERQEKAQVEKEKKRKIKSEENKLKEAQMWNRLNELNSEFKKINELKKEDEKKSPMTMKICK